MADKKKPIPKPEDEKKESQQNPSVKVTPEIKASLEEMKQEGETVADVIRRLMITKAVQESTDGMVVLKMPMTNYRQLLVMQSSSTMSDMLQKAKV